MINKYCYAYNKKSKAWVFVIGSYPLREGFDGEAKYFSVRPSNDPNVTASKMLGKNLQSIRAGDWIEVAESKYSADTGDYVKKPRVLRFIEGSSSRVLTGTSSDTRRFDWDLVIRPAPKDFIPPVFKVGDLVNMEDEVNYYAVVSEINSSYEFPRYKVKYFKHTEYDNRMVHGVAHDSGSLVLYAWQMSAVNKPAPRLRMSTSDRAGHVRRMKFNINSANANGGLNSRFTYPPSIIASRRLFKANGKLLAKVVAEAKIGSIETLLNNAYEILEPLNRLRGEKRNQLFNEYFDHAPGFDDYVQLCLNCEQAEVSDEMMYSDTEGTSFCRSCEDNFVYSDLMGDYLLRDSAIDYFDSIGSYGEDEPNDRVMRRWAERQDDVFLYDGQAFDADTYEYVLDQNGENDGYDDDGDSDYQERSHDGLNGYHSSRRVWKERWENKSYLPLGLEIEVFTKQRAAAVTDMREAFPDLVYLERDGSLNDTYGFEVITQPLGKVEWELHGKKMLNILKSNGCIAYNSPAGEGYGIHININRKYLSPLQEARMFMFLAAEENYNFVTAIAQRSKVYNADLDIGKTTKSRQKVSAMGGLTSVYMGDDERGNSKFARKLEGKGKYAPIKLHDERLEIRIFQSTLNGTSFNKNLEFTWALVEWTSTKAATGTTWMHTDFVKWLAKRAHAERDFPSLVAFLRRDEYTLIDAHPVKNTWLALIPKETRRSVQQNVVALFETEAVEKPQSTAVAVVPPAPSLPAQMYVMAA